MDFHKLTAADVALLMQDPSPENRSRTAASIARQFGEGALSDGERKLAEDIFRLLMKDAEVRVRESLAHQLRQCPAVPHDVALSLAHDVDRVALPILSSSEVLSDEDLVAIVRSSGTAKQVAVASRPAVSETVSGALVDTGDERVVDTLVTNPRARLDESAMRRVVEDFGHSDAIGTKLLDRADLPITIVERLVARASESLRAELLRRCSAPEALASELLLQARERTVMGLLGDNAPEHDVEALVHQLDAHGRLTPSIVVRALCMGDLAFFESALARLAGIPLVNARTLIYDAGPLGLRAVFDKAGLPEALFPAARAGVAVARQIQLDGEAHDRERRSRKIMERMLTQCGDLGVDLDSDDLEWLLGHLGQLSHARPG